MSLDDVKTFLGGHETCVLATVSASGTPQAATVGFSHNHNFEILIGTNKKSRKYQNLVKRPNVAIVVGFEGDKTVQFEGIAQEVTPTEEQLGAHYQKVPGAKEFADEEGQAYFFITPTWLRLTDYSAPEPIFEAREFV